MLKKLDENKSIKESVLPRVKNKKIKESVLPRVKNKKIKESGLPRVKKQEHYRKWVATSIKTRTLKKVGCHE